MEGSKAELEAKLQMRGGGGGGWRMYSNVSSTYYVPGTSLKFSLHTHSTP